MSNLSQIAYCRCLKLHITSFSKMQRLHDFDTILYQVDFLKIDHVISKSIRQIQTNLLDRYLLSDGQLFLFLQLHILPFVPLQEFVIFCSDY